MEMQHIRYFLTLSKTLNFTRAADACNVSQPTLTRAIKALEAELGGDLIRRERGNSHLTPLGHRMVPFFEQCYDAAVAARTLANAVKASKVALLTLGLSCNINIDSFMQPIGEILQAFPGIELKIRRGSGEAIGEMLKSGEVDLAIAGPLGETWERLDRWRMFAEPMSIVVHRDHRLARQAAVEMEHLSGERFLLITGCEMAAAQRDYLSANQIAIASTHEVATDHDLLALMQATIGVSIMPASAPISPMLCRPTVRSWNFQREVAVYGVGGRQRSPVASSLLNLLRAADWAEFERSPPPAAT
jgi:DNA-binding transcriptional LysR family regulator